MRKPQLTSFRRLRADLGKAGFTDITVMPSSFLVRAKDSQGNPVMMVINPDSLTEVTEQSAPAPSRLGRDEGRYDRLAVERDGQAHNAAGEAITRRKARRPPARFPPAGAIVDRACRA